MARLKLVSLYCEVGADSITAEELCVVVNGKRVGGFSGLLGHGEIAHFSQVPFIEFVTRAQIDLYEEDSLTFLGTQYAYSAQAGKGEQAASFTQTDTGYTLTYIVL